MSKFWTRVEDGLPDDQYNWKKFIVMVENGEVCTGIYAANGYSPSGTFPIPQKSFYWYDTNGYEYKLSVDAWAHIPPLEATDENV